MPKAVRKTVLRAAASAAVVWLAYLLRASAWFKLYPAVIATAVFAAFAFSLFRTPLVERFARRMGENLDARGVEYCRRATVAWTVFMALHSAATVATVFAPYGVWAVYNGFVAYILVGAMFLGEYIARKAARRG